MLRIRKRTMRPVRYVRVDLPEDGNRSTAYLWQSDRKLRVGSAVTDVPGWGRVVVVDDPVTRGGVEHVPLAARDGPPGGRSKPPPSDAEDRSPRSTDGQSSRHRGRA